MKKKYILLLASILGTCTLQAQSLSQARELFKEGKFSEALPTFKRLVKQNPANANYNYWYGACCIETGQDSIAEPYLKKAVQRKVTDAYPYLSQLQMNQYRFDEAIENYEKYIDLLNTRKKDTQESETLLAKARAASLMLKGTERICVIDSFVVDKENFLSAYTLGRESGKIKLNLENNSTEYENELGQIRYTVMLKDGRLEIFTSDKLMDTWSTPKMVKGLDDKGNNNYPFLMSDGTTLYYANNGEGSLGGYDIFVTRFNSETGQFLKPENVGMPYNSPANDYLMAIDEFNNLGWFASDRYQPEGKVCVYVFEPNPARETFDFENDGASIVARRAMLQSIRDTWTDENTVRRARQRLTLVTHNQPENQIRRDFEFTIDDHTTYYIADEFRSQEARTLFHRYQQMEKDYQALDKQLENLRSRYADSSDAGKQKLTPQILDLEKRYEEMGTELENLKVKVRNTEKKQLSR